MIERPEDVGRREERAVAAALRKLMAGCYGVCRACGGAIELPRLRVRPDEVLCAGCAVQGR